MAKISCILPTYNRADRLATRILEMQLQTWPDWELIIVDDASTDNTQQVVANAMKTDQRIRYYRLKENSQSVTIPRNIGISWSTGEYIAHIDDDVMQLPHKLEVLFHNIIYDKNCVLIHGNRINLNEQTGRTQHVHSGLWDPSTGPAIDGGQFLYRSACYERVPLVFARRACDWELAKVLQPLGQFKNIMDTVCIYIWHDTNRSLNDETQRRVITPSKFKEYFNPNTKFLIDWKDV